MNDARQAFGHTLRTHRETLGIPLLTIAESTKISVALLSALERGDVSRWPKGIFRRSFFREYVSAIGLPPETLLSDFVCLFPEEPVGSEIEGTGEFRLELAVRETSANVLLKRTAIVAGELSVVFAVGSAAAWMLPIDLLPAIGMTALAYFPAVNLCTDRRPGLRGLSPARQGREAGVASTSSSKRAELNRRSDRHEELQVSF